MELEDEILGADIVEHGIGKEVIQTSSTTSQTDLNDITQDENSKHECETTIPTSSTTNVNVKRRRKECKPHNRNPKIPDYDRRFEPSYDSHMMQKAEFPLAELERAMTQIYEGEKMKRGEHYAKNSNYKPNTSFKSTRGKRKNFALCFRRKIKSKHNTKQDDIFLDVNGMDASDLHSKSYSKNVDNSKMLQDDLHIQNAQIKNGVENTAYLPCDDIMENSRQNKHIIQSLDKKITEIDDERESKMVIGKEEIINDTGHTQMSDHSDIVRVEVEINQSDLDKHKEDGNVDENNLSELTSSINAAITSNDDFIKDNDSYFSPGFV